MTPRLRRSELSVPASSIKMMEKAIASAADLVFLDLEDAVAPAQKKRRAKMQSRLCASPIGERRCARFGSMAPIRIGRTTM